MTQKTRVSFHLNMHQLSGKYFYVHFVHIHFDLKRLMSVLERLESAALPRAVVSGGAGGALAPPEFGSSVNPIPTRGGRLCPPQYC